MKRFMLTKNLLMKIQNLVVSHESQSIKLNPAMSLIFIKFGTLSKYAN